MKIFRPNLYWVIAVLIAQASCNSNTNEKGEISNQDIGNAVEITLPLFATEHNNSGYGEVMEVRSDDPTDKFYFEKEHNTEWYYFKATEDGRLAFTIEPNDPGTDYNFILYKSSGDQFAKEVIEKKSLPLRSNISKTSQESPSTGLSCDAADDFEGSDGVSSFSKAADVVKDQIYYLVIDHTEGGGKGYNIRFEYCASGSSGTEGSGTGINISSSDTASIANVTPTPTLPDAPAPVAVKSKNAAKSATPVRELGPDEEYYTVRPENTMYSVATSHGMRVHDLMVRNRLTQNKIFEGQILIVKKYSGGNLSNDQSTSVAPPVKKSKLIAKIQSPSKEKAVVQTPARANRMADEQTSAPAKKAAIQPNQPSQAETKKEVDNLANKQTEQKPDAIKESVVSSPDKSTGEDIIPIAGRKPIPSGAPAPTSSLEAKNAIPQNLQKLWVYINVVNSKNNNPVNTIIQVVDGKNNKRVDKIPSNQLTYVPLYGDNGKRKIFVLDAFSFRKESFVMDLDNILSDSSANRVALVNDTIVLNFELERYRKNDIFAAYNIYFYDDASVMLPKSKYELESLLEMLKENPKTRIRIHGHTNSSSMGKIISLEPGDHDFFRLTANNKEQFGTAVQLSKRRAESISYYLQYHGVSNPRLDIKGWGGKKMIYEKDVPLAHKNKRVEIEILDE